MKTQTLEGDSFIDGHYLDNTDTQLTEAEVDGFVGNNGYLTTEIDGSTSNETITATSYEANNTIRFVEGGVNKDLTIRTLNANLDANNTNKIINLADPVDPGDAVNLSFLEAKDATDYAISIPISNTSSGVAGDVMLDLSGASLDKGGLISGSVITITEAGVYSVSVQGFSLTAIGSDIDILINGVPTSVLKGTNNYVGTYLFDLSISDTIQFLVKYGASVETVNLQISIFKI